MPHRLTAKADSFIKSNSTTHSRQLADSDKRAVHAGDVLEAETLRQEGTHLAMTAARLNGEALPSHLSYIHSAHWVAEEPARSAKHPEEPAPAAAGKASEEELRTKVLALLAEGRSVNSIAKEFRIGRARIKRWRDGG
ncbi:helix-turn-helix domain-containing protein [Pseudoroseomonas cervicalis]|uniref:helix-turn-helix domain-containing protein n=1 Tax=Teichococcus cervicalis TaxID=204525 RepID=UPI00278A18B4|nr:helix-turn-helix domain-containing protein [Pseudoroseomonas cervicalis]MDQ1079296.1 DNA-binding NarL/FixJ family response regulator [Pseudoroseomonas cervicalis]